MSLSTNQQQLVDQFSQLKSWEDKYRFILRLGKSVAAMDDVLKVDDVLLNGCESNVWFYGEVVGDRLHGQQKMNTTVSADIKHVDLQLCAVQLKFTCPIHHIEQSFTLPENLRPQLKDLN